MLLKSQSLPKPQKTPISFAKSARNIKLTLSSRTSSHITSYFPLSPLKSSFNSALPYSEYSKLLKTSMKQYNVTKTINNSDTSKTIFNSTLRLITAQEKNFIDKISKQSTLSNFPKTKFREEASTRVFIPSNKTNYMNAYHSLEVLKTNNNIVSKINTSNASRQKLFYNKSIQTYTNFLMNSNRHKKHKIRITSLLHKANTHIPEQIEPEIETDSYSQRQRTHTHLIEQQQTHNTHKTFVAYYKYPTKNFPECREQFSLVNNKDKVILLGGMCSVMLNISIWSLNPQSLHWKRYQAHNTCYNKYGHTCVVFHNKLFVFGGKTKIDINTKHKEAAEIMNELDVFNIDECKWSTPSISVKNKPIARRNHIAEQIGCYMLIHGGIDEHNNVLDSIDILCLQQPYKWIKQFCVVVHKNQTAPSLYGHASALVIPFKIRNNYKFSIFKYPDNTVDKDHSTSYIKKVGVYVFGGMPLNSRIPSNDLWLLLIGKKTFEWILINDCKGMKPPPRYFHSMNFYEEGNFLIIHGGRNDELSDSFALNDTYLFMLNTYEWMRIELSSKLSGFKVLKRCAHQAVVYTNKLIVFGGMNSKNYIGSALMIVNLDWNGNETMKYYDEIQNEDYDDYDDYDKKHHRHNIPKYSLEVICDFKLPPIE